MSLTNRERFLKKHNLPASKSLSMKEIATLSKMPLKDLTEVYKRGYGAAKTNLKSVRLLSSGKKNISAPASKKMTPQQWGFGRLYSYVMKQPTTYYGSDKDIRTR